jgi:glycosyltransferase involved in cell wall biosynthesis
MIPNGIDIPLKKSATNEKTGMRVLLYLGRIHPIKGLDLLLQAWARLQSRFPRWELKLVGPDEDEHQLKLKQLATALKLERVTFVGPLYGAHKDAEYAKADLYVLPSFSENFGMSVAEALAQGVPVVTTTGTPWKMLDNKGAGWCVAPEVTALETALGAALAMQADELRQMGACGRAWMEQDFSWEHIAQQMQAAYRWLLQRGPIPDCVRLS